MCIFVACCYIDLVTHRNPHICNFPIIQYIVRDDSLSSFQVALVAKVLTNNRLTSAALIMHEVNQFLESNIFEN